MSSAAVTRTFFTPNERALTYINNMLASLKGLKVLLVDEEMKNLLSILFTQSELLEHEVVFVGMLGVKDREQMKHLNCIIWCRPTQTTLGFISKELQWGNYGTYGLFFSKMVNDDTVNVLANSDKHHLVSRVEEVFLDVTPLAESVSVIPLVPSTFSAGRNVTENPVVAAQWSPEKYKRVVEGLVASMLMMKCRPVIRARSQSEVCERIARDLTAQMADVSAKFADTVSRDCVLLIMERLDDPMTPLLTQRSYAGMIHELLGFEDGNKVSTSGAAASAATAAAPNSDDAEDAKKKLAHIHILNPKVDAVFRENCYTKFDDFPSSLSQWFNEAKRNLGVVTKDGRAINRETMTSNDMAALRLKLDPITRNVERHEEIFSAIQTEVKTRHLTMLTGIEQSLFELDDVLVFSEEVKNMVSSADYELEDALKLTILYHLRYEKSSEKITDELKAILIRRGCSAAKVALIDKIASVAGANFRMHSLWKDGLKKVGEDVGKAMWAGLKAIGTGMVGAGSGSPNSAANAANPQLATSHQPLLRTLINRLYNGRLSDQCYPVHYASGHMTAEAAAIRPKEIMVFIPGGVTFEEAQLIHDINAGTAENRIESVVVGNLGKINYDLASIGGSSGAGVTYRPAPGTKNAGTMSHPDSPMIQAKVSLYSTAIVSWNQFLKSFEPQESMGDFTIINYS